LLLFNWITNDFNVLSIATKLLENFQQKEDKN
jgi:hypothetical protein